MTKEKRAAHRLLCSDLVSVKWGLKQSVAVLEDISTWGAGFQLPDPIAAGTPVEMIATTSRWCGIVRHCSFHYDAYCVGVQFDPATPWLPSQYQPAHELDTRLLHTAICCI